MPLQCEEVAHFRFCTHQSKKPSLHFHKISLSSMNYLGLWTFVNMSPLKRRSDHIQAFVKLNLADQHKKVAFWNFCTRMPNNQC